MPRHRLDTIAASLDIDLSRLRRPPVTLLGGGRVLQAAIIQSVIAGGHARITGDFTDEEAQRVVELLNGKG